MKTRLTEFVDRREWNLTGFVFDNLCFTYEVTLRVATRHSSLLVVIGTEFTLHTVSHIETMDPEQSGSLARLLPLLHQPVASLTAFRSGLLVIQFEDGSEIRVPKDEQYESWQVNGNGEVADIGMLCSPHEGSPWGG